MKVLTTGNRSPCALRNLGMVNALGRDLDEIWRRARVGDAPEFVTRTDLIPGVPRQFAQVTDPLPCLPASLSRYDCRNNRIALVALEQLLDPIRGAIGDFGASRVAIVAGSSTAGVAAAEEALRRKRTGGEYPGAFQGVQLELGGLSEFMQDATGARGPAYSLSTACSTGAKALASGRMLLELGVCDAVVAGAADSLCGMTANGFFALQAMSRSVTNPMSRNRDGLNLGEGAAFFLLTRESEGLQLLGCGESSDAYHMSAPEPCGVGAEQCMRAALADAGIGSAAIHYLNLHGTGTPHNDAMEGAAVARVFGETLPCSSTKPLVGHTLGASGAIEAGLCWLALREASHKQDWSELSPPPHRWDGEWDLTIPHIRLADEATGVRVRDSLRVMSNSFGFGGSNCSLVIGEGEV